MTRIFGSLTNYLVDPWKRCFAKEYLVKAEGESTAVHDFRKCPKCGAFIKSLRLDLTQVKCKCGQVLIGEGRYRDEEKKEFFLKRPLYSRFGATVFVLLALNFVFVVSMLRIRIVPALYEGYFSWFSPFATVGIFSLYLFINNKIGSAVAVLGGLIVSVMVFFTLFTDIRGYILLPYWEKVPTQEDIINEDLVKLHNMPISVERFSYAASKALNPRINLCEEFMAVARVDFDGIMKEHPGAYLRLPVGSSEEREFYALYGTYLNSLDGEAKKLHCKKDPWELATGLTAARYSDTWRACATKTQD